jgi:DNA-binding transcriptional LysR family regulator
MELRQARYVIAVAEDLKFTSAARRCGISQPTLTNSIINLERELGQPFFVRRPKVALMPFGRNVLPQMYRINKVAQAVVRLAEAEASKSPQGFEDCVHNSQSAFLMP